jgi:hypothetical protein
MTIDFSHIKRHIKRTWTWLVSKDAMMYLLFIGMVTLVWWGQTMSSEREMRVKLPIQYTNIPAAVVFDHPLPTHVGVTLHDKGKILRRIQHDSPIVQIDLANQFVESTGMLHIPADWIRQQLASVLPETSKIQYVQLDLNTIRYEIQASKPVAVQLSAYWTLAQQHQLEKMPILEPDTICIYGTKDQIAHIASIKTDSVVLLDLAKNTQKTLGLRIPEGMRSSAQSVAVTWHVEPFTEKTFTLPITVKNMPTNEVIHLFPKELTATVRVGISHFSEIKISDFQAICTYPQANEKTLQVDIICTTPYATNVRSNIREVEYIIERQ